MSNKKRQILKLIKKYKSLPFGVVKTKCNFNSLKYDIILITKGCIENKKIVHLLYKWRKKHQHWFQAQFKITIKGTKIWLEKKVINTPDRLLFLIKVNNKYIGHFGFFRFDFNKLTCEIDNVIRGEAGYPGIINNGLKFLMNCGKKKLGIKNYTLETTSDNESAIRLYSKLGFEEYKRIPLIQTDKNGYNEWIKAPKNYKKDIKRYNVYMKIIN